MHNYRVMIPRYLSKNIEKALESVPAVAILGPRQCGKSTVARAIVQARPPSTTLFLDLERPADLAKLQDPEALLAAHSSHLVCIDEIQRAPDLFPVLRYLIDKSGRSGQFMMLGSASRDLMRQSSETLAGRLRYLELTPFLLRELNVDIQKVWTQGSFPRSILASSAEDSYEWRIDFIRDFLERDVPALQPRISVSTVRRLWEMLAHVHGQLLNMSALANSLDVSLNTVRAHIDLLEGAFMARRLRPYSNNLGKRLVKCPKLYLRDTGVLHTLLRIRNTDELFGHPVFGSSWESFCIENIINACRRDVNASFYRTSSGAELDLVLENGKECIAIEFKASPAPKPQRGFWSAIEDLGSTRNWIISPVDAQFPLHNSIVSPLSAFIDDDRNKDFLI